jgi:hypothetical protein
MCHQPLGVRAQPTAHYPRAHANPKIRASREIHVPRHPSLRNRRNLRFPWRINQQDQSNPASPTTAKRRKMKQQHVNQTPTR